MAVMSLVIDAMGWGSSACLALTFVAIPVHNHLGGRLGLRFQGFSGRHTPAVPELSGWARAGGARLETTGLLLRDSSYTTGKAAAVDNENSRRGYLSFMVQGTDSHSNREPWSSQAQSPNRDRTTARSRNILPEPASSGDVYDGSHTKYLE